MEREEGEMSDNEMDVDDIEEPAVQNMEKHTVVHSVFFKYLTKQVRLYKD